MRNAKLLLRDILESISAIERFVERVDFEDFIKNDEKTSTVIRKFEIIGEATKGIPDDLKAKYPVIL
jgi:uncharacterized protein with HEPN domain